MKGYKKKTRITGKTNYVAKWEGLVRYQFSLS